MWNKCLCKVAVVFDCEVVGAKNSRPSNARQTTCVFVINALNGLIPVEVQIDTAGSS